jgi:hypothetical protein
MDLECSLESRSVRNTARIVQAVLLLAGVAAGVYAAIMAIGIYDLAHECSPVPTSEERARQACAAAGGMQVQTLSMFVVAVVALALMVGALAVTPVMRGLRDSKPVAHGQPQPPQPQQQQQQPPQAWQHHTGQQPPVPPGPPGQGQYGPPNQR